MEIPEFGSSINEKRAYLAACGCNKIDTLPRHMVQTVCDYLLFGLPCGGFLTALFSNDLKESFGRADDANASHMRNWVLFMYNEMPSISQGSREKVAEWIKRGGLLGDVAGTASPDDERFYGAEP